MIAPFAWARDRLVTIPGVDQRGAEAILGEIGADMSRFSTPGHLASWAGMCPGQGVDLRLEGGGQHPSGGVEHDLIEHRAHLGAALVVSHYS